MPITFPCRVCRAAIVVNDGLAGHLVNCRKCKASCRVPGVPGPTTLAPGTQTAPEPPLAVVPLAEPPFVEPMRERIEKPEEAPPARRACPACGEKILVNARKCRHCGEILDPAWRDALEDRGPGGDGAAQACSVLSCVFGLIAFLCFPPFFGIAGFILGIIGTSMSQNKAVGAIGIVLSGVGMIVGMLLGAMLWGR